ncbi:M48 family metallopeptidase [Sphingobium aquiterrae]|uniref:M48 family metallopeptidase n=1 Tax=Sphingobium aquiterrae TaxID=2038656 RepID=UPI00301A41F7
MDMILDEIERRSADGILHVDLLEDGTVHRREIAAENGCAGRFQIVLEGALNAYSDGEYIQIDGRMVDFAQDDIALAAILAHELAHDILDHRQRLNAAGVDRSLFGGIGHNAAKIRATEAEADRLSLYLMANAGLDPAAGIAFWARLGRKAGAKILPDETHGSSKTRLAMLQKELAALKQLREETPSGQLLIPTFAHPPFPPLR